MTEVYLLSIYDKSNYTSISTNVLQYLINGVQKGFELENEEVINKEDSETSHSKDEEE